MFGREAILTFHLNEIKVIIVAVVTISLARESCSSKGRIRIASQATAVTQA